VSADRVFVDTNVLISGLLFRGGNEAEILESADREEVQILLSAHVISEAREVFAAKFPQRTQVLADFLSGAKYTVVSEPTLQETELAASLVRDPDDAAILASVLASKPDVALTGDNDLLTDEVKAVAPTCRVAEYLARREETDD
jgi:putative PIN family toxin of toxin-antitoxin system